MKTVRFAFNLVVSKTYRTYITRPSSCFEVRFEENVHAIDKMIVNSYIEYVIDFDFDHGPNFDHGHATLSCLMQDVRPTTKECRAPKASPPIYSVIRLRHAGS